MYEPSQVVYDLVDKKCIWAYENDHHSSHLICANHKSYHVPGTVQEFKCETCGEVNGYHPTTEYIFVGFASMTATDDERIKHAEDMLAAGRIKPALTLEYWAEQEKEWNTRSTERKKTDQERKQDYEDYERREFAKLDLKFRSFHACADELVEGRSGDKYKRSQFRTIHNFQVIESARRDYILGVMQLQADLKAKYNSQFIKEDYDATALDWTTRQMIIRDVWGNFVGLRDGR